MKKTLLLSIIGFFWLHTQINLQAQEYVPFPMVDASWTEQSGIYISQLWLKETLITTQKIIVSAQN